MTSPASSAASAADPATGLAAALDVGGTKIAAALVDTAGRTRAVRSLPTPQTADPDELFGTVHALLDGLSAEPDWPAVRAVGIGSAGPVDRIGGTVSPVNIPAWRDFPLVQRVSAHPAVAGRPVRLAGDAVAMAAGEHWLGAARGVRNALCMVVSTGVGGGLVLDGRVLPGATGNAGHIGHITVDLNGEPCPCGGRGCLERLAAGPAIVRYAVAQGWRPDGAEPTAVAVAAAARSGDPAAVAAFDRAGQALAAGIAACAALVEIDTAVIGGGVAQSGELLFAPLRRWLDSYATLAFTRGIKVLPAQLGTDAGLVGAAALALAPAD